MRTANYTILMIAIVKQEPKRRGGQILDAFIYHNYYINEINGSVRVGKQVVSWGESVFIQNSINTVNPYDIAAFRRPGAEIKEGLIPVNMVYVSQSLGEQLSVEAFYQLQWDKTIVDNCGTFFSTSDVAAEGCNVGLSMAGSDYNRDDPGYIYVKKKNDREARDSGQYGVALRWLAEELNSTEFGLYSIKYHSRSPLVSSYLTTANPFTAPAYGGGDSAVQIEYPENIQLYGASFQTNVGVASVSGEISYRPNQPLQINASDLVLTSFNTGPLLPTQIQSSFMSGDYLKGYMRKPVTQAQASLVQNFDQILGASRLIFVGEVGYNHIADIGEGSGDEVRFGRDGIYGAGEYTQQSPLGAGLCEALLNSRAKDCNSDGFYTRNSWGYRLSASLEYNGVLSGINLIPSIAWSQDVRGYSQNFNEGSKAASIGLGADYLNTYTAGITYTDFFGGKYNSQTDRDFVSLTFGANF